MKFKQGTEGEQNMIKAVLFDALDTLFLAYPDRVSMYQRIVQETCGLATTHEEMAQAWGSVIADTEAAAKNACDQTDSTGKAWLGFNAKVLAKLGYTGDCEEKGKLIKFESWSNPDNYRLYTDVLPALEALKKRGVRIGCVSNEDGYLGSFFTQFGIAEYFEIILTSGQVGCEKPSPRIFEEALTRCHLVANEVVFVGDSLIGDYQGSEAVGMKPLLIDRDGKVTDDSIQTIKALTEIEKYL